MRAVELQTPPETDGYLADGYLADGALIEHLLGHIGRGTTDLVDDVWREPVANYRSVDRFEAEVELLRRSPVPFCPSAFLDGPGRFVARTAAGIPLVAVRNRDGRVRVFKNSCRHRGTQLVEGTGCAQSLTCPFHGWTYALDGQLRRIPDQYGFPGVDPTEHGLVEVPSHERHGLVIVEREAPTAGVAANVRPRVPRILDERPNHALSVSETVVHANWKILVEGFLEGYHLKATHRETFFPYGYDNVNVVEFDGPDARITFPFRRIERLREFPASDRRIDGTLTRVSLMFPNVIIAELSAHITMVVLEPLSVSTTSFVTYQVGPAPPISGANVDADRADATARDLAFVELGGREDRDMALRVERGLGSGANAVVTFGRFEGALGHFHRQLHAALDRPA